MYTSTRPPPYLLFCFGAKEIEGELADSRMEFFKGHGARHRMLDELNVNWDQVLNAKVLA